MRRLTREQSAMDSAIESMISLTPALLQSQYDIDALQLGTLSSRLPIGIELISTIRNLHYYFHMLDWVSQRESQPSPTDSSSHANLSGMTAKATPENQRDASHANKKRKIDTTDATPSDKHESHPDSMQVADTSADWQAFSAPHTAIAQRLIHLICLNSNIHTPHEFQNYSETLTDAFLRYPHHKTPAEGRQITLRVTLIRAFKDFIRKPLDQVLAAQSNSNDAASSSSSSSSASSHSLGSNHLWSSAAADPLSVSLNPLSAANTGLLSRQASYPEDDDSDSPLPEASEANEDQQPLEEVSDDLMSMVLSSAIGPWFIQAPELSPHSPFSELMMLFDLCVDSNFIDNNKKETDIAGYLKTLNGPQFECAINQLINLIDTSDSTPESHAPMAALGAEQLDNDSHHDMSDIEENIVSIANELLNVDDNDHRNQSLHRLAQFMSNKYPFIGRALFIMASDLDVAMKIHFNDPNIAGTVTTPCNTEVTYKLNRANSRTLNTSLELAMTPPLRPTRQKSITLALDVSASMGQQGSGSNMDQVITATQELLNTLQEQQLSSPASIAEANEPTAMASATHTADSTSLSSAAAEPLTDASSHRPHTEPPSLDLVATIIIFGKGAQFLKQITLPHADNVNPASLEQVRNQITQQIEQLPERISIKRPPLLNGTQYRGVFDTIVQWSCASTENVTLDDSLAIPQGSNVFMLTDGKPSDHRNHRDEARLPGTKEKTVIALASTESTRDETHDNDLFSWVNPANLVRINPEDASPIFNAAEGLLVNTVQHIQLEITFKNPTSSDESSHHRVFWIPCSGENTNISLPIPPSVLMSSAIIELSFNDQTPSVIEIPSPTIHSDESPWGNSRAMIELVMSYRHHNDRRNFNRMATSSWGGHPGLHSTGSPTIPEALFSYQSSQPSASEQDNLERSVTLMRERSTQPDP